MISLTRVTIETGEKLWSRMSVDGHPHDHAFVGAGTRPVTRVIAPRGGPPAAPSDITVKQKKGDDGPLGGTFGKGKARV